MGNLFDLYRLLTKSTYHLYFVIPLFGSIH